MSFKVPDKLLTDGQCRMMINGIQFIQVLLEANGLAAGKDHQFKGRYDAEKNAVMSRLQLRAICLMLRVPAFWTSSLAAW